MKFSIIIPVYNVAQYLRQCLDSIIGQTFGSWEAICIDDGSSDASPSILDSYAKSDHRISVIHQANAGVSVSRNLGLDKAQGDWVIFVDADDYIKLDLLERLAQVIDRHKKAELIAYCANWLGCDGVNMMPVPSDVPSAVLSSGDDVLHSYRRNGYARFVHCIWDKAFRRDVVNNFKLRFENGVKLSEDSNFVQCYLARCGEVVAVMEELGYYYRQRDGSAVHSITCDMYVDQLRLFNRLLEIWKVKKTPGLQHFLKYDAAALLAMGSGEPCRSNCVDALMRNQIFNRDLLPYLMRHGSIKGVVFSSIYFLVPTSVKRLMLMRV